ncbi:alpha-2-macroglobulin family protein [Acidisoma sp. 7E03]
MPLLRHLKAAVLLVGIGVCLLPPVAARAQDAAEELDLPGLQNDAANFRTDLQKPFPAGVPLARLKQAKADALAALKAKDYARALPSLKIIAAAQAAQNVATDWEIWLAMARGEMAVTPQQPKLALEAGWLAFTSVDTSSNTAAEDQAIALDSMREALAALKAPVPQIHVLAAMARRLPKDAPVQQDLMRERQAIGLVFDGVDTDAESFPTRACLRFLGDPSSSPDFHPGDWVQLDPAVKDAAVTLESRQICITGLPAGATSRVTLRHGMPGDGGLSLAQDVTVPVAMPDRTPRLVFDGARYLQPRSDQATVALDSVGLSAVKLQLVKISERNLLHVMQSYPPGSGGIDRYGAQDLAQNQGRTVWSGSAEVPHFSRNALLHTVLPLPAALKDSGLYALIATPGDGTPFAEGDAPGAVQLILRTDLAPTLWHGTDGDTVQLRSYQTGLPVTDVTVDLIATDNSILASARTDHDGLVHFAAPLLAGQGGEAPAALHIRGQDGDFTRLDLGAPDFDLSDRGASGQPQPGPVDPFIWTDRGIYRPGETVQVMALLRDESGAPTDLPLHLIVTRPDGRVFQDTVPARTADAAIHQAVILSKGAPFGTWNIALKTDPQGSSIAEESFQVDAFVPPRLAVEFAAGGPQVLAPGTTTSLPINVRFLYGAPGNDLSGSAVVNVTPNPTPFPDFKDYSFGLADDSFSGSTSQSDMEATDDQGHTAAVVDLSHLPDTSVALQADVTATVNDPAGRSVSATTTLPIRPQAPMIGIAEDFAGGSVNADSRAGFRIAAVAPDGKRIAMPVQLRLVRQTPDWRLSVSNGQARYETVWRNEPVDSQNVTLASDGSPFSYGKSLPFGRYRLEVLQANGGMAVSSVVFYSGWAFGDNPDVPARVSVRADKDRYTPGETALIHVEAPYAGPATVLVMTDRVKRLINLPASGASFDLRIPVTADWGPGAYVGVHVFRPGAPASGTAPAAGPGRAIGLTWLALDPKPRTLPLSIATQPVYRPRTTATFAIKTTPGAWVTLAAVDEGILALTQFQTPDPLQHFFGKRTLGVGIHDDFARLLAPAGDATAILRQGAGGDLDAASTPIPQKIVSLFAGPVQAGPDGVAAVPLDLPDFDGTLRLMAVGWDGTKTGSLGQDIVMRDQAIVEPLLPRFLAPGDQAQIGIMLQNLELPAGTFTLHVAAGHGLHLAGGDPTPITLAQQQRLVVPLTLTADTVGMGELTVTADGPGGFHVAHDTRIGIHSARPPVTQVSPLSLPPGASQTVTPDASAFIPGTWTASATFGLGVRYSATAMVQALEAYPLDCLEQLTSRGLPLAMLTGPDAGANRAAVLQQVVSSLADRQRYDGAFGLWSATGDAEPWLTAYATDMLLRARQAGAAVPQPMIDQALGWLTNEVAQPPGGPTDSAAQAYALYVLSLAGRAPAGAIRVAAASIDDEPTPLARAQIAAALARLGQADRARAIFTEVLAEPARKDWYGDYGSSLRDQLATAVLVAESGLMPDRLPAIRAALPGADLDPANLNTQEEAWAGAAAGALQAQAGAVTLTSGGKTLGPAPSVTLDVTQPVTVGNPGKTAVSGTLAIQGVPATAPPAARANMEVHRHFFAMDGSTVDPDKLPQNSTFVMEIDGKATDGQDHHAMVLAGLPAGWEIAGHFSSGDVPGMGWLGTLSETDAEAAADDRYAVALTLPHDQPSFRLAVILRAVTPGTYDYPGILLQDMYRPTIFARQGSVHISVTPPTP